MGKGQESQSRTIDMGEVRKIKNDLAEGCQFRVLYRALKPLSGLKV